jgi:aminoglycoside phosphotransferase (APT) family kinase protein
MSDRVIARGLLFASAPRAMTSTDKSRAPRAPLRAVDWRFLLPDPPGSRFEHLVLLGGTAELAARALEVGLAGRISHNISGSASADAVVVLHRARVPLRDAARCLSPGGVLYYEVDRLASGFRRFAPERIRQALHEAGLSGVALYAVMPDFRDPRMYLPLDVAAPLRWYVDTRSDAFTLRQLLVRKGLRAATGLDGRRFARFAPRIALTAVAGETRPSAPSVLDRAELPSELRGKHLRPVLLTHGGDRVIMLPFPADGAEPAAVLKVPKLPGFNGRTEHEQATLRTLWSRLGPALRRSVPRPLGMLRHGEVTVAVESYASGPLLSRSGERRSGLRLERLSDLQLATAWLADFHVQAQISRPAWGVTECSRWVEEPLERFRETFGLTSLEEQLFAATREYARSLDGTPLPMVLQHRDFTVWNIARRGAQLHVLDWEGARPGPALCDLLHFIPHWYETVHHAHDESARQRCFRRLLFARTRRDRFREAADEAIDRYLGRLDMSARFRPLLMVYTWVELALRRADQQQVQEEAGDDPRAGNRNFAFLAILAEHAARLFADYPADGQAVKG